MTEFSPPQGIKGEQGVDGEQGLQGPEVYFVYKIFNTLLATYCEYSNFELNLGLFKPALINQMSKDDHFSPFILVV